MLYITIALSVFLQSTPSCTNPLDPVGANASLLLCESDFSVAYDTHLKSAIWVREKSQQPHENPDRKGRTFRANTNIDSNLQAHDKHYYKSGYDRGHMAAAADRTTPESMAESFAYTNITPQLGPSFNRGIWRKLEREVRNLRHQYPDTIVWTGIVVLEGASQLKKDGPIIAQAFWKLLYDPHHQHALAYLMPHRPLKGYQTNLFQVSVDQLEAWTGLDFLSSLDDELEITLEAALPRSWEMQTASSEIIKAPY